MALLESSPPALLSKPSSHRPRGIVRHDEIVRPIGGVRKGKILHCEGVQFAERVRNLMRFRGLTIEAAAEKWGYAIGTIKNWRGGKSEPTWSEWTAIERAELRRTG